ncbi:ABC transporter ATP-binding protein [Halobacteriovorax sp. HLS]|uniref:ABC transporter ATP-binding protein n=1 Tax=Halobacteriovorax sp. HLS TaxID=2234000 RepID=UPI000FDB93B3|nr:dipeptide ABC transporter ATP-binding protein [Halobacteriovorax sp. HLS]
MILEVKDLKKHYPITKPFQDTKYVKALDGVSFSVSKKKTLGIVGESGCGKSTLAKTLMGLESKTDGSISFEQKDIFSLESKDFRKAIQMIFQDPYSSLNPRKKAWQLISEPLMINTELSKQECFNQAISLMEKVGLRKEMAERYPHMFSGGQRQRLGIARALALHPKVLICDEPVSALDVSIQAQVLNLLMQLQDELELTYLFISHDLHVVNHISDEILVMYLGKIVEYGPREKVFDNPIHPYTKALIASSPSVSVDKNKHEPITGELPSPLNPPTGCAFHKRCPIATQKCSQQTPPLESKEGRMTACFEV